MAKKRRTKKKDNSKPKEELSPAISKDIAAIVCVALALLLILAALHVGGTLVSSVFTGLRLVLGYAAYLLPVVLGLLAWLLFQPEKYEVGGMNYAGLIGFMLALAGLLHFSSATENALSLAKAGQGGGMSGYAISRGLLGIVNVPAAVVILLTVMAICLVMAANARLSDIYHGLIGLFRRGPKEEIQINEPAGLNINNRLPIRGQLDASRRGKDEMEALTVMADADWVSPELDLLASTTSKPNAGNVKENAAIIQKTLDSFGIEVAMGEVNVGPTVTQYTLKPSSGVKLNKITGLDHNLSLALAAHPLRIEAPIPGKSAVGVEVPNKAAAIVSLKDILATEEIQKSTRMTFALGRDVSGRPALADLSNMPHLLIAGATGTGKSVMINSLLTTLLYRNSPSDLKLILVDPKRVELTPFNGIPHLLAPVITEDDQTISALKWAVAEMQRRYKMLNDAGKRNIVEYNSAKPPERMPYIVIVIDEMAQLMQSAGRDAEALIVQLAQLARATGIHLVLATQRPSVNVITGLIKANIPARVAFTVASQIDSRTILDQSGAEKLLGKGDMLFISPDLIKPIRVQGALIQTKEVNAVNGYLRSQREPQYNEEVTSQPVKLGTSGRGSHFEETGDDDLFEQAAETVIRSGKASASLLQRRLRVGYARAARLLDLLEERGVVGPPDGARPRDVLVDHIDNVATDITYEE
ncbi:MAG TPA: DNA translocase FtsK 4TM domain-containing protein [Candidatus Saccharimonadales bacterium]|nr:DNA translocase FtsK 4TM domain-containing protein [Candidatus Saccharimonadales bacterium]